MEKIIGSFVEVHPQNTDDFEVGEIIISNPDYVIIKAYDMKGEYDGYLIVERNKIDKIKYKGKYLDFIKSISKLCSINIPIAAKEDIFTYAIENSRLLNVTCPSWSFYKIIKPIELDNGKLTYQIIQKTVKESKIKCTPISSFFYIKIDCLETRTMERSLRNEFSEQNASLKLNEIYEEDSDGFEVGEIVISNKDSIIIKCYDKFGEYNGFICQTNKHLTKINTNTVYLDFMKKVIFKNEIMFEFTDKESIIRYALENRRLLSMLYEKCKYCYFIKVNNFDGQILTYQIIDQVGKLDEEKTIDIKKIEYLNIDSSELRFFEKIVY